MTSNLGLNKNELASHLKQIEEKRKKDEELNQETLAEIIKDLEQSSAAKRGLH